MCLTRSVAVNVLLTSAITSRALRMDAVTGDDDGDALCAEEVVAEDGVGDAFCTGST